MIAADTLDLSDEEEALEQFHRNGWTDGLPVILPTPARLERFLAAVGREGPEEIGSYDLRSLPVTVQKVATNAIMAGCLPEHLPVVISLVECLLEPKLSLHVANSSTGSLALGFIVNGPVRHALDMNCHGSVLGPGNRANASIGRALRLIQTNVMGSIAGAGGQLRHERAILDRSTIGHPAKYCSYHIVENEELFPQFEPFHVSRGFGRDESVVSAFALGNHVMLSNHFEKTPDQWIDTVAHYLVGAGRLKEAGFGILLVPPESAEMFVAAGWSKQDIATALFERSRRSVAWVKRYGWKLGGRYERGGAVAPGDEERMVGAAGSPGDIGVVICGGPAGNFPTYLQTYAESFEIVSRRVGSPTGAATSDPQRLENALAGLRSLLKSDGFVLDVTEAKIGAIALAIRATDAVDCADCLVPPPILERYVRDALKDLPSWRDASIELRYP